MNPEFDPEFDDGGFSAEQIRIGFYEAINRETNYSQHLTTRAQAAARIFGCIKGALENAKFSKGEVPEEDTHLVPLMLDVRNSRELFESGCYSLMGLAGDGAGRIPS